MAVIDHLVLAVPDLETAIAEFAHEHGVRPAYGGRHVGLGTHNALVSLGDAYLELVAPDPNQPNPDGPRPFGVDEIHEPRLVTWAARPDRGSGETLEALVADATAAGHDPGPVAAMERETPDGRLLRWRLTFPSMAHDGLIPFLIDWGETAHPASTTPAGLALDGFSGATADPARANKILAAMALPEIAVPVEPRDPGLAATYRPVTDGV